MNSEDATTNKVAIFEYIPPADDAVRRYADIVCKEIACRLDIPEFASNEVKWGLADCLIVIGRITAQQMSQPSLN